MTLKSAVKAVTPPIAIRAARKLGVIGSPAKAAMDGPFSTWAQAAAHASGWDSPEITAFTLATARKVRDSELAFERDGIGYDTISYSPALLSALLLGAARYDSFDVIDFGGGLGSNFYQHRRFMSHLGQRLRRWRVVERPIFAEIGEKEFTTERLCFYDRLPPDTGNCVFLFTGSLHNLPEPFSALDDAAASSDIIALDRVRISSDDTNHIFVQRPDPGLYYAAAFPIWCLSRKHLVEYLARHDFSLVEHFPDRVTLHDGLLFTKELRLGADLAHVSASS